MKNRSKSWLCFHPGATMDEPFDKDLNSVYIAVKREENSTIPRIPSSKNNIVVSRSQKKSSRQAISRIVKAVFSETAMAKSRKVQQDPYHTLRSLSDVQSSRKPLKKDDDDTSVKISLKTRSLTRKLSKEDESTSASCSSSSSSTSNLSSRKSSFRMNILEPKLKDNVLEESKQSRNKEITHNKSSSINGLYLLLVILMVLIFWGRICAIVCTSTWIYFGPFRRNNEVEEEVEEVVVVVKPEVKEMESREYKKRVIMEGLLERTHSRF
ncbi:hypothetical protein ACHQM5_003898 [Ranunculus cassubicifolius]